MPRRPIDRTSTYYWQDMVGMMSNESLREFAKNRKSTMGVYARAELARRDAEVTFAEPEIAQRRGSLDRMLAE